MFHDVFDGLSVGGWQVVQEPDQLRILVAEPRDGFDPAGLSEAVRLAPARQGAPRTQILVEPVGAIPRTANGKTPLIRALRR